RVRSGEDGAFGAAVNDNVRTVTLGLTGGYLDESIEIGRLIRRYNLDTTVPSSCMSACVLIWASGRMRTVDGELKTHCPVKPGSPYQCEEQARQRMLSFLREMNAPAGVVRMQEAANWMPLQVTRAQLAEAPEQLPETEPRWREPPPSARRLPYYAPPPPGWIFIPYEQRAMPCLPTLLTLGMVRFCI